MEDMPDPSNGVTPMSRDFLCEQHNQGLKDNTAAIATLTQVVQNGFKNGENRMDDIVSELREGHIRHDERIVKLESDVRLTRKAKIVIGLIGGIGGVSAAVLWMAGPLKSLARMIIN